MDEKKTSRKKLNSKARTEKRYKTCKKGNPIINGIRPGRWKRRNEEDKKNQKRSQRKNYNKTKYSYLLVKAIVRCWLINRQPNLIKSGNLEILQPDISLDVIVGEIGNSLFEHDIVMVHGDVSREVVPVYRDFLVRGRLTTFHVQSGQVRIIHE